MYNFVYQDYMILTCSGYTHRLVHNTLSLLEIRPERSTAHIYENVVTSTASACYTAGAIPVWLNIMSIKQIVCRHCLIWPRPCLAQPMCINRTFLMLLALSLQRLCIPHSNKDMSSSSFIHSSSKKPVYNNIILLLPHIPSTNTT